MTTQELIDELASKLGNRTDLDDARYVLWLNWALDDICGFHEKRLFPPKRFRELQSHTYFQSTLRNNLCGAAVTSTSFQVTGADAVADADSYNGMVVELDDGQKRLIVDYDGAAGDHICTVSKAWDTNPDATVTYLIYQKEYSLDGDEIDGGGLIWAVERMERAYDGSEVSQEDWQEFVGQTPTESADDPTRFTVRGNAIVLGCV